LRLFSTITNDIENKNTEDIFVNIMATDHLKTGVDSTPKTLCRFTVNISHLWTMPNIITM